MSRSGGATEPVVFTARSAVVSRKGGVSRRGPWARRRRTLTRPISNSRSAIMPNGRTMAAVMNQNLAVVRSQKSPRFHTA